jgi:hypothetical protein
MHFSLRYLIFAEGGLDGSRNGYFSDVMPNNGTEKQDVEVKEMSPYLDLKTKGLYDALDSLVSRTRCPFRKRAGLPRNMLTPNS